MHRGGKYYCIIILILAITSCQSNNDQQPVRDLKSPVQPEVAISTFEIAEGLKIELLAAEPLISDPVDMEIDEYGRLYVVEMHGYPLDKTGTGVIKLLSDTSGDGRMDKSIVFAVGLTLPNSIMRWKKKCNPAC